MPVENEAALSERAAEKDEAVQAIAAVMHKTEGSRDRWQRLYFIRAIDFLQRAAYGAATANAALALTPADRQTPVTDALLDQVTTDDLKTFFANAAAVPVSISRCLGPLEIRK